MPLEFRPDDPTYPGDIQINPGVEIEDVIILVEDMLPRGLDTSFFDPKPNPKTRKFEIRAYLWVLEDTEGSDLALSPQEWTNDEDDPPEIILEYSYIQTKGGLRLMMPHQGEHYSGKLWPNGDYPSTEPGYVINQLK